MTKRNKVEYQITIPSYKRQNILITQTLQTLKKYGAPMDRVTVFVANPEEKLIYDTALEAVGMGEIRTVVGVVRLGPQRQFIDKYYPKGTPLVSIDDDLADLLEKEGDKTRDMSMSFDQLVSIGFDLCKKSGAKLWSIYPVANGKFMSDRAVTGLKFMYGCFHGSYTGEQCIEPEKGPLICHAEDWERMFRSYLKYGKVARIEWVATKSKFFAKGGMMEEAGGKEARLAINNENILRVANSYPSLCSTFEKAGGIINIRLKRKTDQVFTKEELLK
jgi:hypothetical protein